MSKVNYVLSLEVEGIVIERKVFELKPDTQASDRHRILLQAGLLLQNFQDRFFKEKK